MLCQQEPQLIESVTALRARKVFTSLIQRYRMQLSLWIEMVLFLFFGVCLPPQRASNQVPFYKPCQLHVWTSQINENLPPKRSINGSKTGQLQCTCRCGYWKFSPPTESRNCFLWTSPLLRTAVKERSHFHSVLSPGVWNVTEWIIEWTCLSKQKLRKQILKTGVLNMSFTTAVCISWVIIIFLNAEYLRCGVKITVYTAPPMIMLHHADWGRQSVEPGLVMR